MSNRTIFEVKLIDLLPENLRQNPDIVAASKAIDTGFLALVDEVKNIIILPRVNELNSGLLDHLAYYLHVDFYDVSFDVETKRKLVQESVYLHQIKGTPRAVEVLISDLFDEGRVEEWFEYSGEPGYFQVVTTNTSVTNERAEEFIRALDSVKNKRSWLDRVIIEQVENMSLYWGVSVHIGSREEYR